jgi:hypothetical protein
MKQKSHSLAVGSLLLICFVCLLSSGAISSDEGAGSTEAAREALGKWVENQRIISKEKRDFALAIELLTDRIEMVKGEIGLLRGKVSETEKSIAETDEQRAEMIEENEKLKNASESLGSVIATLEGRTEELLKRLPDPIRDRVKPLSQRLPDGTGENKLSVAERFQNIVGILDQVDKFNRDISVTSEVRTLPDGNSVEVAAFYVGIGQAYYAGANGTIAGVGTASDEAWEWKEANESAAQIADAIAILKNEKVASFVQVPVEIK